MTKPIIDRSTDAKKIISEILKAPALKINPVSLKLEDPKTLMCLQGEYGIYQLTQESKFSKIGTKELLNCISILISDTQGNFFFGHFASNNLKSTIINTAINQLEKSKSFSVILIGGLNSQGKWSMQDLIAMLQELVQCAKTYGVTFTLVGQRLFGGFKQTSDQAKYLQCFGILTRKADILHRYLFCKPLDIFKISKTIPDIKDIPSQQLTSDETTFFHAIAATNIMITSVVQSHLKTLEFKKNDCERFERYVVKLFNQALFDTIHVNSADQLYRLSYFLIDLQDFSITPIPSYFMVQDEMIRILNCKVTAEMTLAFNRNGIETRFKLSNFYLEILDEVKISEYPRRWNQSWLTDVCGLQDSHYNVLLYLQNKYLLKDEKIADHYKIDRSSPLYSNKQKDVALDTGDVKPDLPALAKGASLLDCVLRYSSLS